MKKNRKKKFGKKRKGSLETKRPREQCPEHTQLIFGNTVLILTGCDSR